MPLSLVPAFDLGAPLRSFRLPEPLTGRLIGPEDYPEAEVLLVAFLAAACPHVQHVARALAALTRDFDGEGLQALAVNSSAGAPQDEPAEVAAEALRQGYIFPYLIDQTQAVARTYRVACTPDFYLFGRDRRLVYHGRFDETRHGGDRPAHGGDLGHAIRQVLDGGPPPAHQVAAQGCDLWRTAGSRT